MKAQRTVYAPPKCEVTLIWVILCNHTRKPFLWFIESFKPTLGSCFGKYAFLHRDDTSGQDIMQASNGLGWPSVTSLNSTLLSLATFSIKGGTTPIGVLILSLNFRISAWNCVQAILRCFHLRDEQGSLVLGFDCCFHAFFSLHQEINESCKLRVRMDHKAHLIQLPHSTWKASWEIPEKWSSFTFCSDTKTLFKKRSPFLTCLKYSHFIELININLSSWLTQDFKNLKIY